ncbi:hypothetical protein K2173_022497 [Erythroxylum novogranatense]|uniref:BRCT domain-containing protein n=1 Tax=Erythroxylum novogranatense TaxID=1862640 RepID=A0AAV8TI57_9ROSI|nr:hypothetical protein K2173_022497 [Erythroxylum novogranatense]
MDSVGDGDDKFQPIKDKSAGEEGMDANEFHWLQDTVPYDETVPIEDAIETQILDFGCETQVLDDGDFCEVMETQLIDEFLVDSDSYETKGTQVLGCHDELSDDESGRGSLCDSLEKKDIQYTPTKHGQKGLRKQFNSLTDEQHASGSAPRFTSVRTASLRASGLVARHATLKGTDNETCSLESNIQFFGEDPLENDGSKGKVSEEIEQLRDKENYDGYPKGLMNGRTCKVGRSTVRNLFSDYVENEIPPSINENPIGGTEVFQFPTCNDGLAGLSYLDSQEPGESSQANALACVQKLIEENKELFENEVDHGKNSLGKTNCISTTKGPQVLAKKSNDSGTNGKGRIFDWDDKLEDEGGGDIFRRRKEEFFGKRFFSSSQKLNKTQPSGCRDKEGNSSSLNEKLVHSASELLMPNSKVYDKTTQGTEMDVKRTLLNEFNEQFQGNTSAGTMGATLNRKNMPAMSDVGCDTQMAAEAMELLFNGEDMCHEDATDLGLSNQRKSAKGSPGRKTDNGTHPEKQVHDNSNINGVSTRKSKRKSRLGAALNEKSSISYFKDPENARKLCDVDVVMTRSKKARTDAEKHFRTHGSKISKERRSEIIGFRTPEELGNRLSPDSDACKETAQKGDHLAKKRHLTENGGTSTPIACRTRQSLAISHLKSVENVPEDSDKQSGSVLYAVQNSPRPNLITSSNTTSPRGRRSLRNMFSRKEDKLDSGSKPFGHQGNLDKILSGHKGPQGSGSTISDLNKKSKSQPSASDRQNRALINENLENCQEPGHVDKLGDAGLNCGSAYKSDKGSEDRRKAKVTKLADRSDTDSSLCPESAANIKSSNISGDRTTISKSKCTSPANTVTPINEASPICVGNGYCNQSSKKLSRSCLLRELNSLYATELEPISPPKELRKRRDLTGVRVLFSHHLDEDVLKQQKKILDRLKISTALSITDATHFITDTFVRTRNMLEAIALGKPIVTHQWLENVGHANYLIDEKKYILRDTKKEKEFGFSLPLSLAHARQHPLLQGKRVLITRNAKPSKEIVSSLVKAVQGQAVERVGRSSMKDDTVPDDLLVLSCEEDYEECVPFLEKGAIVYSSELLLSGIVTQKLEYERHRIFADHVKRTRSTIWLKKDGQKFVPVNKK